MSLSYKHIGFLIGIVFVFGSFLFVGRAQDTYNILLLGGLAIASVFYLAILFGKESPKTKLTWTVIMAVCAVFQQLTEPLLVDGSYRIYIHQNKNTLADVNNFLQQKKGDIAVYRDSVKAEGDALTVEETTKLLNARQKLGAYLIIKSEKGVYYGLWGFLDVRLGIRYLYSKSESGNQSLNLTGSWHH